MNKMYVATLAVILAGALLPTTGALELSVQTPLLAVVTIELPTESPQARPTWTASPGWACGESIPWMPSPQGEARAFEVSCVPEQEPTGIASWSCRNPAVEGHGQGLGTLTVTAWCDGGVSVSCTAQVVGTGQCHNVLLNNEEGTPPLRCRVDVSPGVFPWSARCYNDP